MAPHAPNTALDPEALALPDGPVSEEEVDLLREYIHETLGNDGEETIIDHELIQRHKLPWYRRPTYWWMVCLYSISMAVTGAVIAPKVEVYQQLVCRVYKPDIFDQPQSKSLDDDPLKECIHDPVVAAAVSRLLAVATTTLGILTCMTSASWGSFSDRHGRTYVICVTLAGLLITELNIIFVAHYSHILPGGYWFVVVGFVIEGLLGGIVAGGAAIQSYIADTTTRETRSRTLSLLMGASFTGFAVGPTLGGLLVRATRNPLSVFYLAVLIHAITAIFVFLCVPESLSKMQMQQSRLKHNNTDTCTPDVVRFPRVRRLLSFLTPLNIFLPELTDNIPLQKKTRDWNLTILVVAYAFTLSILGSYPFKFQYAEITFDWDSGTMGVFMSIAGAARAFHLTVILPVVISLVKYIRHRRSSISSESQPLISSETPPSRRHKHSPRFDLNIARISLFIETIAFTAMSFATTGLGFLGFGLMGSLGGGFAPATQAVALELYNRRGGVETGKLFGALSVVQALSSQIIGPALYGLVFMNTVKTVPRAIFYVSASSVTISFLLLLLVRIPKRVLVNNTAIH